MGRKPKDNRMAFRINSDVRESVIKDADRCQMSLADYVTKLHNEYGPAFLKKFADKPSEAE